MKFFARESAHRAESGSGDVRYSGRASRGAREYPPRAFLNGKMDLVQAEAVADVIHSTNASGLYECAPSALRSFSECVRGLSERVREMSSRMELEVDFVEEEADADVSGWRVQFSKFRRRSAA